MGGLLTEVGRTGGVPAKRSPDRPESGGRPAVTRRAGRLFFRTHKASSVPVARHGGNYSNFAPTSSFSGKRYVTL